MKHVLIMLLVCSCALPAQTVEKKRDDAFGGFIRNTILTVICGGSAAACWMLGDNSYAAAQTGYAAYKNAVFSADAAVLGDAYSSAAQTADMFYYSSEAGLVLAGAFLIWGVFDFVSYLGYAEQINHAHVMISPNAVAVGFRF